MTEKITIPAQPGLDGVFAYFDDIAKGEGRVILVCWDMAYTAYWGAMGDRTVKQFFIGCDVDYIASRMSGRHYKRGIVDQKYLEKIINATLTHLKYLEDR